MMGKGRRAEIEDLIRQAERENDDLEREYRMFVQKMEQRAEERQAERNLNLRQMNEYGIRHSRLYDIMEEQEKRYAELERIHETIADKIRRGFREETKKREDLIMKCREELNTLSEKE